jgi:hypothetical protein
MGEPRSEKDKNLDLIQIFFGAGRPLGEWDEPRSNFFQKFERASGIEGQLTKLILRLTACIR